MQMHGARPSWVVATEQSPGWLTKVEGAGWEWYCRSFTVHTHCSGGVSQHAGHAGILSIDSANLSTVEVAGCQAGGIWPPCQAQRYQTLASNAYAP